MPAFGVTRVIVRGLIPDLYRTFKTAGAAFRFLDIMGLTYRRKDWLADWREILGLKAKEDVWKYIPKKFKPSLATFERTELKIGAEYQYIGRLEYIDTEGIYREKIVSFLTDEIIPIEEAENIFSGIAEEEKEAYDILSVIGVIPTGGRMRG